MFSLQHIIIIFIFIIHYFIFITTQPLLLPFHVPKYVTPVYVSEAPIKIALVE